jgi:colicin import membrane protein
MLRINQARRNRYLRTSQRTLYGIVAPTPLPWLRTLREPPLKLIEDDWPLIEHIRATGQIDSGSLLGNDHLFERGIPEHEGAPPLDMNARERLAAQQAQDEAIRLGLLAEKDAAAEKRRKARERSRERSREREELRKHFAFLIEKREREEQDLAQAQAEWQLREVERATEQRQFSERQAADREAAREAAAQRRVAAAQEADERKARVDAAMDIAIAQRNAVQQAIVAKVAHAHRKAKIAQVLETARIRGQGEISVQMLMQAIDCFDDVEIYSCMQELGLQWRMPPKDVPYCYRL